MSDGRVTNSKTREVEGEDVQKFVLFNNKTSFIAFTGNRGFAEHILVNADTASNDYDKWVHSIKVILQDPKLQQLRNEHAESYLQMAFGGINQRNELELYTYNSIKNEIVKEYIPPDNDQVIFLGNNKLFQKTYDLFLEAAKQKAHLSPSDFISTQRIINNFVADNDPSVNKNTFRAVIKRL